MVNFSLCWNCCEEEGREEVSRDVTDSGSDTFSRGSNGLKHSQYQIIFVYFTNGINWRGIPLRYSLNSHCFEECPHCHNHTLTPFSLLIQYLPLICQNISHAKKYRPLIANNQKQFTIVFPYRCFLAFALLLITNKT